MTAYPTEHQIRDLLGEVTGPMLPDLSRDEFPRRLETTAQNLSKLQMYFITLGEGVIAAHQAKPFTSILCEDRGGRLPAVFLRAMLSRTEDPVCSFFPYKLMLDVDPEAQEAIKHKIAPYVDETSPHPLGYSVGKRPLVVTDRIVSGMRMDRIIDALQTLGLDPTIATLSYDSPSSTHHFPPTALKKVPMIRGASKASHHFVGQLPLPELSGLFLAEYGDRFIEPTGRAFASGEKDGLTPREVRALNFATRRYLIDLGLAFLSLE